MPDPAVIDADLVRWYRDPAEPGNDRPVVVGVEHWVRRCADELATFTELGAPWSLATV